MQDYNYVKGDCMEITLELSCCKYPHRGELPRFWAENRKSLLVYLAQVHRGVRGLIMDVNGNLVPRASLKIKGRTVSFRSSKRGEYWRLLLPGIYTLGEFLFHFIVFILSSLFFLCFIFIFIFQSRLAPWPNHFLVYMATFILFFCFYSFHLSFSLCHFLLLISSPFLMLALFLIRFCLLSLRLLLLQLLQNHSCSTMSRLMAQKSPLMVTSPLKKHSPSMKVKSLI